MAHMDVAEDVELMILDLLRAGVKARKIARQYGLSYKFVIELAHVHGIKLVQGREPGYFKDYPPDRFMSQLGLTVGGIADRRAAVVEELKLNDNLAEIGRQFNLTRERVRQIAVQENLLPNNRKAFLRDQNLELVKPILDRVSSGMCNRCGEFPIVTMKNHTYLCEKCRERRRQCGLVLARLRAYLAHGSSRDLSQAAWTIREYGLTLEEIRRY